MNDFRRAHNLSTEKDLALQHPIFEIVNVLNCQMSMKDELKNSRSRVEETTKLMWVSQKYLCVSFTVHQPHHMVNTGKRKQMASNRIHRQCLVFFITPTAGQISLGTITYLYRPFPKLLSVFVCTRNISLWGYYLQRPPQTACITLLLFPWSPPSWEW